MHEPTLNEYSLCSNSPKMSKKTCMFSITALILSIVVFGSIASVINNYYQYDICHNKYCDITSELIKNSLNTKIHPCDDFHGFVCSKFENETKIPDDKVSVSSFSLLSDELELQLKELLDSKILDNEIEPFKLMKRIYRACNDIDKLNERGLAPLFDLSPDFQNWPIMYGDLEEFDWKDDLLKYRYMEAIKHWIIGLTVSLDFKNSTRKILEIGEPSLTIDREYLIKGRGNKRVIAYYGFMTNISNIINDNENRKEALGEIVDFEIELAKLQTPREDKRNATKFYNLQTLGDIENKKYKMFEPMGFLNYTNALIIDKNDNELIKLVKFDKDEPIINKVPDYLRKIDALLEKTPKRIIKNYLTWKCMLSKLSYLTEDIRNIILEYNFHVSGLKKRQPRWKECISLTQSTIPYAVNSAYIRQYFDEESKAKVEEIVKNIKNELKKIIENLDWMDTETKKFALIKLNKMKSIVGYPKELLNDSVIIEEYKNFYNKWNDDDLFGSLIRLDHLQINDEIKKIREPFDKNDWKNFANVAVVNAFYTAINNAIILPAGILQGLFFDKKLPSAMNYGGIGTVIGHELTHGFDDQGSQFDENGNLRDWWTPTTKKTFIIKKNKIVEQYSNYTEPLTGLHLNGNNTQGENVADNGGIIEAYRAFQNHDRSQMDVKGLGLNERQFYWISYARLWCAAYKKEALEKKIITGMHSPNKFRINGPLQNNVNFAMDFNCKNNSPMNPKKKNVVWS